MTGTVLDEILQHKRAEVAERRAQRSLSQIEAVASTAAAARGFRAALAATISCGQAAVIAEVKKASPSKGVIREDFDVAAIARSYETGGASCLSVLTDERFFKGHDDNLVVARNTTGLPVLRKDFIVDCWQIAEARALGADCILLIVAALGPELGDFYRYARYLDLDVLVEVHDRAELDRAAELGAELIGINNRDLRTFTTRLETTYALLPHVPAPALIVTESGIHDADQVAQMRQRGVDAFLVGEAFMRAADPGAALSQLFGTGRH